MMNLFTLFLCLKLKYYSDYDEGAPLENVKSVRECQQYKNINTTDYCCRVYLESSLSSSYYSTKYDTYT